METNTKLVNIVVYAETEDEANNFAAKFGQTDGESGIWTLTEAGVKVNLYTRWPNCLTRASPVGITDILFAKISSVDSENWESAKKYVDQRRGIPQKFLVSENDLSSQAAELKATYLNTSEIQGISERFNTILHNALNLEETLRKVFNTIDVDGDGFIVKDEIIKASSELNHVLNSADAEEIVNSLSTDGKVSFAKFKQWWVMGRSDFNSFRRIVSLEMHVNNFFKSESGLALSNLFEQLKKDSEEAAINTAIETRVNIESTTNFVPGTALRLHLNIGNSFNEIMESSPEHIRKSPFTFGLEINLKNPDQAQILVQTLTQLKDMASSMIPQIGDYLDKEVFVNFRQTGNTVSLDVTLSGPSAEQLAGIFSMFDLNSVNFRGNSDIHLCSDISPFDLLTINFEEFCNRIFNWKLEGHGDYSQIKNLINFASNALPQFASITHIMKKKEAKAIVAVIKGLCSIRTVNFKISYDSQEIINMLKDLIGENFNDLGELFNEKTTEIKETLNQVKGMAGMFLSAFSDCILAIDFEKISVYVSSPLLRAYVKFGLNVRGLNDFVQNILTDIY